MYFEELLQLNTMMTRKNFLTTSLHTVVNKLVRDFNKKTIIRICEVNEFRVGTYIKFFRTKTRMGKKKY